jgi:uncharacterized YigZ family protein
MTISDDHYYTISARGTAEFKDRGSKFIAYTSPVSDTDAFKSFLAELRKAHSKAIHHCFAYRIGTDGNLFRQNDDGEPSGTAGKPILGQIDSKGLTNVAIVVVRYWGGTLLGVPGLINAYKTASALALQVTPVVQKQIESCYEVQFDYTRQNEVLQIARQFNCTIIRQEMHLFCSLTLGIPRNRLEEVLYRLQQISGTDLVEHPA